MMDELHAEAFQDLMHCHDLSKECDECGDIDDIIKWFEDQLIHPDTEQKTLQELVSHLDLNYIFAKNIDELRIELEENFEGLVDWLIESRS